MRAAQDSSEHEALDSSVGRMAAAVSRVQGHRTRSLAQHMHRGFLIVTEL